MKRKDKIIFFLLILMGLGLINYPFVSQWVNRRNQSSVIYGYQEQAETLTDNHVREMLTAARQYNRELAEGQTQLTDSFAQEERRDPAYDAYENLLNVSGDGMMGWIEIPRIDVMLPVYHGTGVRTLENGVGHLYGSSLPVGGEDTHAILSAHTGLASRTLFTDLDKLETGDCFFLYVLDEMLAYQVTEIETVLPYETENLQIVPGKDLITLVTCTPYGINSHRLLVTGERISWTQEQQEERDTVETADGKWIWSQRIFIASVILLAVIGILLLLSERKGRKRKHGQN